MKEVLADGLRGSIRLASGDNSSLQREIVIGPILILSQQPMLAALVGVLVELEGCRPVFANSNEQPAEALRRLRPLGAVLVDCEIDAAQSDLFFALASRQTIRMVVFGPWHQAQHIAKIAGTRGVAWCTLPPDPQRLASALGIGPPPRLRTESRRKSPETMTAPDGTRVLKDTGGRHWMIYDRRTIDRRQPTSIDGVDRVFVAEDGEIRHCALIASDADERSPAILEAQLETGHNTTT